MSFLAEPHSLGHSDLASCEYLGMLDTGKAHPLETKVFDGGMPVEKRSEQIMLRQRGNAVILHRGTVVI